MKTYFLKTTLIASVMLPVVVGAQATTSVTQATIQPSTVCAQTSIEKRDTAIAAARTVYSDSMTAALTARKDAEKLAVALDDKDEKKEAIKTAVNAYKTAAKSAQETLTTARKAAWAIFETEAKNCKSTQENSVAVTIQNENNKGNQRGGREGLETRGVMNQQQNIHELTPEERKSELQKIRDSFKTQMQNLRSLFN
jgi:hypothetical protein